MVYLWDVKFNSFTPFRPNRLSRILLEILIWYISFLFSSIIRNDGKIVLAELKSTLIMASVAFIIFLLSNYIFSVYTTKYRVASTEELIIISRSVLITGILLLSLSVFSPTNGHFRVGVTLVSCILAIILNVFLRLIVGNKLRYLFKGAQTGIPTLIYGAGIVGQQVVDQMLLRPNLYNPIGFLDDSQSKQNFVYMRRKVLGTLAELSHIVKRKKASALVVAISELNSSKLLKIESLCRDLGISMRIVPSAFEIIERNLQFNEINEVSIDDILGRNQIDYEFEDLNPLFSNKRVLITGAGGSIGSEIAKQVQKFHLNALFLLDRDENSLLKLSLGLNLDGLFLNESVILCDIRDSVKVSEVIQRYKPDIVFHAAALKHLSLLEKFPEEALKTNVNATKELINACLSNDVKFFVNISTDKAADPTSELGKTKFVCERLIAGIKENDKKYISVRFGNVVGSNGSFLNTFKEQIRNGGPITVTDPEVSRYFMTVGEAVYLVLQSILVGECGETLILDMGEPVKIDDVAKQMISISGKDIKIMYTGLRLGEKLHENLIGKDETVYRKSHSKIMHTRVYPLEKEI